MGKKYIGIDPSTKTGVVILSEDGSVIEAKEITTKVKEDPQRFMDIANQVIQTIDKTCKGEEVKVTIEGFSYGSKGRSISTQYGIGWALRIMLVESKLNYTEVPPSSLKKFATGKGDVSKDGLVLPIYKLWGFESHSDNIRDAYVLAQIARALDGKSKMFKYQEEALKKVK